MEWGVADSGESGLVCCGWGGVVIGGGGGGGMRVIRLIKQGLQGNAVDADVMLNAGKGKKRGSRGGVVENDVARTLVKPWIGSAPEA
jgi:hypothetical protein